MPSHRSQVVAPKSTNLELDRMVLFGPRKVSDIHATRVLSLAAKVLGFRGVRVSDEQGTSYMIDMLGRERDLRCVAV